MKAIDRMITKFCYKHPRFGIKNLMMIIVVGNIAVWLLTTMDTTNTLLSYLIFVPELILKGQVWRLFTFVFIPPTFSAFSLAISLYFYYFIGKSLEGQWGKARFTLYYICGMVLSVIVGFISGALGLMSHYGLTGYYINMSMFLAFATMWPDAMVMLFFFIPIKMKWLALIDAALFVFDFINGWNIVPLVALLNYFIFCGDALIRRVFAGRRNLRRSVEFKSAVRQAEHKERSAPYRHKCAVCGRTDVTDPELEFRYCSRCEGYHCFCQDHINNHVHFTE